MKKKAYFTIRVNPEIKERLKEIAKKTRYSQGEILEKMVLNTRIDEEKSQFYTSCSSEEDCNK